MTCPTCKKLAAQVGRLSSLRAEDRAEIELAGKEDQMDVNSKEAELWSETMRLKSSVEHKDARIELLEAAFDAFSKAISVSGGPSLTMQRHDQTWEAWKTLCNAFAALAGTEGT